MLRSRMLGAAAVALAGAMHPFQASAQAPAVDYLVLEGRFEEAAATVATADPGERARVAELIFNRAYTFGHQAGDREYAVRGFAAGRQLVSEGDPMYQQLTFWHGFALFRHAVDEQLAQTLDGAQRTLPMFLQARELLLAARTYGPEVNVNVTRLLEETDRFIEIQNAVIRRGR